MLRLRLLIGKYTKKNIVFSIKVKKVIYGENIKRN